MTLSKFKKLTYEYIIPLFIVVLATIFSIYLLFNKGAYLGDDITFHESQVYDLIYGFKHGQFFLSPNHIVMGQFGYYAYGYYGPFSHYFAAIFAFIFNTSEIVGIKATMLIVIFTGNIATFFLAKYITKNNSKAIIGTIFYAFMPYIVFCALCRFAFAEVVALSFIPLVFYSLIRIVNDEHFKVLPYVTLIISSSLLSLSHAFTTLVTATFAFIYLLFNIKRVINFFKDKKRIIYLISSLASVFCIAYFYLIPALFYQAQNLYIVSNDAMERTDLAFVMNSTNSSFNFSGFFNTNYINNLINNGTYAPKFGIQTVLIIFAVTFLSMILAIVIDMLLEKKNLNRYIRYVVVLIISFVPSLAIVFSYASLLTLIVFYLTFLYVDFAKRKEEKEETFNVENVDKTSIAFFIISIIVLLLLIFTQSIWTIMPSAYRKCQFAWRLFGLLYFFVAILLVYLLKIIPFKKQYLTSTLALSCCLLIFSQPLIEKQIVQDTAAETKRYGYTDEDVKNIRHSGWLNEFVPQIYSSEYENYVSQYSNSLYRKVRRAMIYQDKTYFVYDKEDYYYATLEGKGSLTITELKSPSVSFIAKVEEDALFQLPQFYYEGYALNVVDVNSNKTYTIKLENIDCLLAFRLEKGEYNCSIEFKGTSIYQAGHFLFALGVLNTVAIGVTGSLLSKKKRETNNIIE